MEVRDKEKSHQIGNFYYSLLLELQRYFPTENGHNKVNGY